METRRQAQVDAAAAYDVFHAFQFRDGLEASGITFVNWIVDDATRTFKAAHYDHGTGLAVADVDLDGHPDLYFVNQVGGNELWRNQGDGSFEDITDRAGVAVADRIGVTASFADIDNDGDPDLYVTSVREGNVLFENVGAGRFADITGGSGLAHTAHSSGAVFFDYDRDGWLDLFLTNVGIYTDESTIRTATVPPGRTVPEGEFVFYEALNAAFLGHLMPHRYESSRLYRNLGEGRFEDVTEAVGLEATGWSGDAVPMDGNGDGWLDLYVLDMQGNDAYYENQDGEGFVDRSRDLFPKTPFGSMGVQVFDFDSDEQLDLYVTDMHSDMSKDIEPDPVLEKEKSEVLYPESYLQTGGRSIFGNALYRRLGPNEYAEVSDEVGAENYWPWGLSVGDLNADGFDDVFITSGMSYPYRYGINSVLLNEAGMQLRDSEFLLGVEPRPSGDLMAPWFELDCSGEDESANDCEDRSGRIQVWSALSSRSSAILDLEGDGDLDIVTNEFHAAPQVLISNLSEAKAELNFITVELEGTTSNRDGLGARVTVHAGGHSYLKVNDGKSGYLSQSQMPLYFGLGAADAVDRIEVTWPTGERQVVEGPIPSGSLITVEEGTRANP